MLYLGDVTPLLVNTQLNLNLMKIILLLVVVLLFLHYGRQFGMQETMQQGWWRRGGLCSTCYCNFVTRQQPPDTKGPIGNIVHMIGLLHSYKYISFNTFQNNML